MMKEYLKQFRNRKYTKLKKFYAWFGFGSIIYFSGKLISWVVASNIYIASLGY